MTKDISELQEKEISIHEQVIGKHFQDCLETTTVEHLKYCNCQETLYQANIKRRTDEVKKQLKKEGITDQMVIDSQLRNAIREANTETEIYCINNNIKCSKEKHEIMSTVELFVNKYAGYTDDPIFIEIVKSVLNFQLITHRLKKAYGKEGLFEYYTDKDGNNRRKVNELLGAQRSFDNSKINALVLLDKKLNGEKSVQVNLNTQPLDLKDLYNINLKKVN